MNGRKAFTLVELLVVIAIIALLMAILMPALNRVREQGRMVKCEANMKQWCLIGAMYTEENDGKFWRTDPASSSSRCYWWIRYIDDKYKDWKTNKLWFCPSAQKPEWDEKGVRTSVLNIYNAWGIYKDTGRNGVAGSYGINGYLLIPTPTIPAYEGGVSTDNGWKTASAAGANNVPFFNEALRFDQWPLDGTPPGRKEDCAPAANEYEAWSGNNMGRVCINRHQGFVSTAFLDFSVRRVGLKELYTLKWHRAFNTAGPWTKAGGVTPLMWPKWIRNFPDY